TWSPSMTTSDPSVPEAPDWPVGQWKVRVCAGQPHDGPTFMVTVGSDDFDSTTGPEYASRLRYAPPWFSPPSWRKLALVGTFVFHDELAANGLPVEGAGVDPAATVTSTERVLLPSSVSVMSSVSSTTAFTVAAPDLAGVHGPPVLGAVAVSR